MNLSQKELMMKVKDIFKDKTDQDHLINELISGDKKDLQDAEKVLFEKDLEYREKTGRKYISMLLGLFLMAPAGWFLMPFVQMLTNSLYDRTGLEGVTIQ
jgi:hypothetical protein